MVSIAGGGSYLVSFGKDTLGRFSERREGFSGGSIGFGRVGISEVFFELTWFN